MLWQVFLEKKLDKAEVFYYWQEKKNQYVTGALHPKTTQSVSVTRIPDWNKHGGNFLEKTDSVVAVFAVPPCLMFNFNLF